MWTRVTYTASSAKKKSYTSLVQKVIEAPSDLAFLRSNWSCSTSLSLLTLIVSRVLAFFCFYASLGSVATGTALVGVVLDPLAAAAGAVFAGTAVLVVDGTT